MANETSELHVPWPTHPDGSNKRMGEMTADEQRVQWKAAALRFKREIEHLEFAEAPSRATQPAA